MGVRKNSADRDADKIVIQDNNERHDAAAVAAPSAIICLSTDHRIIEWNHSAEKLYGFTRDEVLGKDYLEMFIPVEHQAYIADDIVQVLDGKDTEGFVNPIVRRDGHERIVSWTVTRMLDALGTASVIAVGTDITEHRWTEQQYRQEQNFSESLINCSVDGILAFDRDCHYTVWNPAMERISGVSKEICIGQCAFDVFPFLKETGEDQYFWDSLAGKESVAKERAFVVPETGREGFFEGHYSPLYDANGEIQGGLAIIRDITERKRHQQQIQHHQEELIHAARLSTMGELAGGLAHELNQPLFAISNYCTACQLMLQKNSETDTDELIDLLEKSESEAHRAGKIISRLKEFVRKRIPCRSAVNVNQLIENACELIEFELRRNSVVTKLQLDDDLPLGSCDSIQIQQVLINLVRNGIEAMVENSLESRELVIQSSRKDDTMIEIAVRDNGVGLPAERPDRVFEMFYSTKDEGMGMGLAISRSIVEAHRGKIWSNNISTKGTEFRFTLPAQQIRPMESGSQ